MVSCLGHRAQWNDRVDPVVQGNWKDKLGLDQEGEESTGASRK